MEPASPLKSITNTAQLAPSQTKQQSQSNGTTTTTALTNGTNKSIEENSLWPPNSTFNKDNVANNRKFNSYKLDSISTASSNDNDNLFFYHMITNTNGNGISSNNNLNNNTNNGFNLSNSDNNGLSNGFHTAATNNKKQHENVIMKNGFDSQHHLTISSSATSNLENNNLFTPDADFVADFGSANIFNAMNGKTSNTHNSNANQQNHMNMNGNNNNNNNHTNGFDKIPNGISKNDNNSNGFTMNTTNGNASENFADFEHNTIYNAAGNFIKFFCLE